MAGELRQAIHHQHRRIEQPGEQNEVHMPSAQQMPTATALTALLVFTKCRPATSAAMKKNHVRLYPRPNALYSMRQPLAATSAKVISAIYRLNMARTKR